MSLHVSFLGMGKMGLPMARHLSKAGVQLTIWNRTNILNKTNASSPDTLSQFTSPVTVAESAPEAVRAAGIVMMMLWDAASIEELFAALTDADFKDRIFISHVTISPKESVALAQTVISKGGRFIEAPVLGNSLVAERGALQVLVGGDKELFEKYAVLFKAFGTPRYLGHVGAATSTKLALNFILGANLMAFATSYGYLENSGVDLEMFLTILTNGPFALAGGYHKVWADHFNKRRYEPVSFATAGLAKDLDLAWSEFDSQGINNPAARAMAESLKAVAEVEDYAALDMTALYEIVNATKASEKTEEKKQ